MEESSQPGERRDTKRPQSSLSTLLSFVFKKPKGDCPEPDDASSEFQAFTFVSNCTYTFDRAWLYSVNPILYLTCFVFARVTTSLCRRLWWQASLFFLLLKQEVKVGNLFI